MFDLATTTLDYKQAIFWFIAVVIGLKLFEKYLVKILHTWAEKTRTDLDNIFVEILESTGWTFYIAVGIYVASRSLKLSNPQNQVVSVFVYLVVFIYLAKGLEKLAVWGLNFALKNSKQHRKEDPMVQRVFGWVLKIIIYGGAFIFVLQNLGFQISALLGGLGIGGIAIAFALQNVLADLFSYFTIYFDRPFEIGDFIVIGKEQGTVEKIGLKSTRIRTLQGEELVMSNQELTSSSLHNFKKLKRRRVVFNIGVTYNTSTSKLKKIPNIISHAIKKQSATTVDRIHFISFGDFALNFECVYYLNSSDYAKYMDTQQAINLIIKQQFEKNKIEMAFPTQTIQLQKT